MHYMSIIEFDNQRFDDLYQKYAGMIFRTAYNFLLNKDDAEDIVQEVFIKYFISNKTFNDDDHEKAWILTVTANLSKNVLRSKSRQNLELDDTIKIVDHKFDKAITNHLEFFIANAGGNIQEWTYWDLSSLGKVSKIEFNMAGDSDNGYGFSQPAYFCYDDVAVRF